MYKLLLSTAIAVILFFATGSAQAAGAQAKTQSKTNTASKVSTMEQLKASAKFFNAGEVKELKAKLQTKNMAQVKAAIKAMAQIKAQNAAKQMSKAGGSQ